MVRFHSFGSFTSRGAVGSDISMCCSDVMIIEILLNDLQIIKPKATKQIAVAVINAGIIFLFLNERFEKRMTAYARSVAHLLAGNTCDAKPQVSEVFNIVYNSLSIPFEISRCRCESD